MGKFLNLIIKGIFLGIANIIPGVSGGTIAVVLRIFDEMIEAINNIFKNPKKHIKFLLPLTIGAIIGILIFSKILEFCLIRNSLATNMFFVGLVAGSIPLIYKKAKSKEIKPTYYIISIIAFLLIVIISEIGEPMTKVKSIAVTIPYLLQIMIYGVISSSAMVIPGISGSFVMVLLGIYNTILTTITSFTEKIFKGIELILNGEFLSGVKYVITSNEFLILLFIGVGVIIGIILISKLIEILLRKAFSFTYFSILGLIAGSIYSIFRNPETYSTYRDVNIQVTSIAVSIVALVVGYVISKKLSD